jgi:hypothetical protein
VCVCVLMCVFIVEHLGGVRQNKNKNDKIMITLLSEFKIILNKNNNNKIIITLMIQNNSD